MYRPDVEVMGTRGVEGGRGRSYTSGSERPPEIGRRLVTFVDRGHKSI